MRIMIVVNDREAGDAYAAALGRAGVEYDVAPSFSEMAALAMAQAYSGLIIDVLTLVRCSKEEKVIAYDCINHFPVLRVKWEAKQKRINLIPMEHEISPDVDSGLRFFIDTRCRPFPARTLRRHKRKHLHLSVLLSRHRSFPEDKTAKTFTVTLSMGGAFLYTMERFEKAETLWLRFTEFPAEPVAVKVRWSLKWGENRGIPGIGVSFESLSAEQEKELDAVLN